MIISITFEVRKFYHTTKKPVAEIYALFVENAKEWRLVNSKILCSQEIIYSFCCSSDEIEFEHFGWIPNANGYETGKYRELLCRCPSKIPRKKIQLFQWINFGEFSDSISILNSTISANERSKRINPLLRSVETHVAFGSF